MKTFLSILLICFFSFSCKKDRIEPSYFIFGYYKGMCPDGCATFYKIEDDKIYSDNTNSPLEPIPFNPIPLPDSIYQKAIILQSNFPTYLLNNTATYYGAPDSHDQGTIYLEIKQGENIRKWRIDPDLHMIPAEIRPYIQLVQDVLSQIS